MKNRGHLLPVAANMAMNSAVSDQAGSILNMSFGEAQLHPPAGWEQALLSGAGRTRYGAVPGEAETRAAVADYYENRGLPASPEQIVIGPGTKPLLLGLMYCTDGPVFLPAPSWLTYFAQAALLGRHTVAVPAPHGRGGVPDPQQFETAVKRAARDGSTGGLVLLTRPDNPTATSVDASIVRDVVTVANEYDVLVIADEIYHELRFARDPAATPGTEYGTDSVRLNGPSKSFSLGGLRAGFARMPDTPRGHELALQLAAFASHTWSSVSQPAQAVLAWLYRDMPRWNSYLDDAVSYYRDCAMSVARLLREEGVDTTPPDGGFYVYPDFSGRVPAHIGSSLELQEVLLRDAGLASLAGSHFGDLPERLTMRMSLTSLGHRGEAGPRTTSELRDNLDDDLARLRSRIQKVMR